VHQLDNLLEAEFLIAIRTLPFYACGGYSCPLFRVVYHRFHKERSFSMAEFIGDGQVLNGQKVIAPVRYVVRVDQPFVDATHTAARGSVPGLPRVECVLTGLPNTPATREQLTLVMADGRRLNFFVVDGSGRVQPTGPIYTP
jgi:hypothetical protein